MKKPFLLLISSILLLSGCHTIDPPCTTARIYVGSNRTHCRANFAYPIRLPLSKMEFNICPTPLFNEYSFACVEYVEKAMGSGIMLRLTDRAARDLHRVSVNNIGNNLFLFINGSPLGFKIIDRPITDGNLFMYLEAPDSQVQAIYQELQCMIVYYQNQGC